MSFTLRLLISGLAALVPAGDDDDMWLLLVDATNPETKVCGSHDDLPTHSALLTFRTENFDSYCRWNEAEEDWICDCPCLPCPTCLGSCSSCQDRPEGCDNPCPDCGDSTCTPQCWCPWPPETWSGEPTKLLYDTDGDTLTQIPIRGFTIRIAPPQDPSPRKVKERATLLAGDELPRCWSRRDVRWLARMQDCLGPDLKPDAEPTGNNLSSRLYIESGNLSVEDLAPDETGRPVNWSFTESYHRQALAENLEVRLGKYTGAPVAIFLEPFKNGDPKYRLRLKPRPGEAQVRIGISNLPDPHFPRQKKSEVLEHFYWYYTLKASGSNMTLAEKLDDKCPAPSIPETFANNFSAAFSAGASETCPLVRF